MEISQLRKQILKLHHLMPLQLQNGLISCQRTIEHFRQTRKFGCWGGKDIKENCNSANECIYHPENDEKIQNKCDLRNGVIWKRTSPDSPFTYGKYYLEVIKIGEELLESDLNENILDIKELANQLESRTGKTFKSAVLGYIQRGGSPTVYDRNFAMELAVKTIDLLKKGYKNRAVGTKQGNIIDVDIKDVLTEETNFDFELYQLFKNLNS